MEEEEAGGGPQRHQRGRYSSRNPTPYSRPTPKSSRDTVSLANTPPVASDAGASSGDRDSAAQSSPGWAAWVASPFKSIASQLGAIGVRISPPKASGEPGQSAEPAEDQTSDEPEIIEADAQHEVTALRGDMRQPASVLGRPQYGTPPPWVSRGSRMGSQHPTGSDDSSVPASSFQVPSGPDAPQGGYRRPDLLRTAAQAQLPVSRGRSQQVKRAAPSSVATPPPQQQPTTPLAWQPMQGFGSPQAAASPAATATPSRLAKRARTDSNAPSAGFRGVPLLGAGIAGSPATAAATVGMGGAAGGSGQTPPAGSTHTRISNAARSPRNIPLLRGRGGRPAQPSRLAISSQATPPPSTSQALTPAAQAILSALDQVDTEPPVSNPFAPPPLSALRSSGPALPPPPSASLLRNPGITDSLSTRGPPAPFGPALTPAPFGKTPAALQAKPAAEPDGWSDAAKQLHYDLPSDSRPEGQESPAPTTSGPAPLGEAVARANQQAQAAAATPLPDDSDEDGGDRSGGAAEPAASEKPAAAPSLFAAPSGKGGLANGRLAGMGKRSKLKRGLEEDADAEDGGNQASAKPAKLPFGGSFGAAAVPPQHPTFGLPTTDAAAKSEQKGDEGDAPSSSAAPPSTFGSASQPPLFGSTPSSTPPPESSAPLAFSFGASTPTPAPAASQDQAASVPKFAFGGGQAGLSFSKAAGDSAAQLSFPKAAEASEKPADGAGATPEGQSPLLTFLGQITPKSESLGNNAAPTAFGVPSSTAAPAFGVPSSGATPAFAIPSSLGSVFVEAAAPPAASAAPQQPFGVGSWSQPAEAQANAKPAETPAPFGNLAFGFNPSAPSLPASSLAGFSPAPQVPATSGGLQPGAPPAFVKQSVSFGQSNASAPSGFVFGASAQPTAQPSVADAVRSQWQAPGPEPPALDSSAMEQGADEMMAVSPPADKGPSISGFAANAAGQNGFAPAASSSGFQFGAGQPQNMGAGQANGFAPNPTGAGGAGLFGSNPDAAGNAQATLPSSGSDAFSLGAGPQEKTRKKVKVRRDRR
ncbi:hypothetical protein WJX73_006129 [Symbiochloris irregularis]|uniref:Proteophosphoglycan ppg4 n=1 Tax=Symbiochloris irregularis TaxID=706552 RepID=A0AAW1P0H4_9CHLO